MISLQETIDKTAINHKRMQAALDHGYWHPEDATLTDGLKAADAYEVQQFLRGISLSELLAKSSTTGISGAAYTVAAKVHDTLIYAAQDTDLCPLIGYVTNGWKGGDLTVNIAQHRTYQPHKVTSGAKSPEEEASFIGATLSPATYSITSNIGGDMLDDQQYGLIQWHVEQAGKACGEKATDLAFDVMKVATDGDGTLNINAVTGDVDETKWTGGATNDVEDCITTLEDDRWIANTMISTPEAWHHSIQTTYLTLANDIGLPYTMNPPAQGFDVRIGIPPLDVKFSNSKSLHAWTTDLDTGDMTNCVTFVFDRNNALLTGRKRWLELRNYANPIEDLAGASITFRQDSVSLYNDAIAYLYET